MLKLHIIQARNGDCLLLEFGTPSRPRIMLIDGGPATVYSNHLRGKLQDICTAGGQLDLVVLSHVDDDHVRGLLDLFKELQSQQRDGFHPFIRVNALWHNTFSQTLGPEVEVRFQMLMSEELAGRDQMVQSSLESRSIAQGDELTRMAYDLDLPMNPEFLPRGVIAVDYSPLPFTLGNLRLQIVGPTRKNLERLGKQWEKWLDVNEKQVLVRDPLLAEQAAIKADRSIPNLSSIMFLAEAGGKTILFTGDGRGQHLLAGLRQMHLLDQQGRLHVDVLKVPHHGSARNVKRDFFKQVTADTYVISADGSDHNPDLITLVWIVDAAQELGREIQILVTNETESTRKLLSRRPSDQYSYRLVTMPPQDSLLTLDLVD